MPLPEVRRRGLAAPPAEYAISEKTHGAADIVKDTAAQAADGQRPGRLVAPAAGVKAAVARGLIMATPTPADQDAKHARLRHLLAKARSVSPVFVSLDLPPLPLAIGFAGDLLAGGFSKTEARNLLGWRCGRPEYHVAVAAGGRRHHADGGPGGEVSDADREHAALKLAGASSP
jgi:hypothetical protein